MGFWIYFGIYSFSIIIIWAFFVIAKIHSLKFKNYQPKIIGYTNLLTIALVIFTILGYIFIFFLASSNNSYDIKDTVIKLKIQKQMDNFSDISEKDEIIPETAGADYY